MTTHTFSEISGVTVQFVRSGGPRMFFSALLLAVSSSAVAAEWSIAPQVAVNGRYDDNPDLTETGNEDEIYGGVLDLTLTGQRTTERSTLQIRPRLYFDRYDDSDEDSDNQYLDVYTMSRGQRSTFSFAGNISNEQVRRGEESTVEFAESELDDPDQSATGRVDTRRDRLRWRVRPEYSFDLSERNRVGVGGQYIDTDYNNELPGEALDYSEAILEIFFQRAIKEDSRLRVTAFGSKYESDEISNDSKSFGGSLTYEQNVTETFSWYLTGGAQNTDVEAGDNDQIDESQTSYLFASGLTRSWERTRVRTEISRWVAPSGTGFLKTRDGIRVNIRHQFRQRWSGEVGILAFKEDNLDDAVDVNKRDYVRGLARLNYQMAPEWFLETSYVYTYQDYDDTPGDATSNSLFVGVVYRPLGKTWAR